jgi:hypothetical protein
VRICALGGRSCKPCSQSFWQPDSRASVEALPYRPDIGYTDRPFAPVAARFH